MTRPKASMQKLSARVIQPRWMERSSTVSVGSSGFTKTGVTVPGLWEATQASRSATDSSMDSLKLRRADCQERPPKLKLYFTSSEYSGPCIPLREVSSARLMTALVEIQWRALAQFCKGLI